MKAPWTCERDEDKRTRFCPETGKPEKPSVKYVVRSADGKYVAAFCESISGLSLDPKAKENAELVTLRVNVHEELLEALENARAALSNPDELCGDAVALRYIDAALAKARGE